MAIKARFYVSEIVLTNTQYTRVKLLPSMKGEDNHEWSKYTPSGELWMNIHNDSGAVDEFKEGIGSDFELTFEKIDRPAK